MYGNLDLYQHMGYPLVITNLPSSFNNLGSTTTVLFIDRYYTSFRNICSIVLGNLTVQLFPINGTMTLTVNQLTPIQLDVILVTQSAMQNF